MREDRRAAPREDGVSSGEEAAMRAAFFKEHGGPDKIIWGDYKDPALGPSDVLVKVRACGLNHVDLLLLDGRYPPPEALPHVHGCDVPRTVPEVGSGS